MFCNICLQRYRYMTEILGFNGLDFTVYKRLKWSKYLGIHSTYHYKGPLSHIGSQHNQQDINTGPLHRYLHFDNHNCWWWLPHKICPVKQKLYPIATLNFWNEHQSLYVSESACKLSVDTVLNKEDLTDRNCRPWSDGSCRSSMTWVYADCKEHALPISIRWWVKL